MARKDFSCCNSYNLINKKYEHRLLRQQEAHDVCRVAERKGLVNVLMALDSRDISAVIRRKEGQDRQQVAREKKNHRTAAPAVATVTRYVPPMHPVDHWNKYTSGKKKDADKEKEIFDSYIQRTDAHTITLLSNVTSRTSVLMSKTFTIDTTNNTSVSCAAGKMKPSCQCSDIAAACASREKRQLLSDLNVP